MRPSLGVPLTSYHGHGVDATECRHYARKVTLGVGGITAALLGSGLQGSIPIIGAGWLLILATSLWYVYRITKGWLWLRERERL